MRMEWAAAWVAAALALAFAPVAPPIPPELTRLAAQSRVAGTIAAWCRGEFRSGHAGAFAAAVADAPGGGRYLVLQPGAPPAELSRYSGQPDLACHTVAEARRLNETIGRSEMIAGRVAPRWNTAVVFAFVDGTTAACWQYSPSDRAFVGIGGWTT